MEPCQIDFDSLVRHWCKSNGWTYLQKVNEEWWAIAPNLSIPEPVCSSEQWLEQMSPEAIKEAINQVGKLMADLIAKMSDPEGDFVKALTNVGNIMKSINSNPQLREFSGFVEAEAHQQPGDISLSFGRCQISSLEIQGFLDRRLCTTYFAEDGRITHFTGGRVAIEESDLEEAIRQARDSVNRFGEFVRRQNMYKQGIATVPEPEINEQERSRQQQDRRNQETMRRFVGNRIGGKKWWDK